MKHFYFYSVLFTTCNTQSTGFDSVHAGLIQVKFNGTGKKKIFLNRFKTKTGLRRKQV